MSSFFDSPIEYCPVANKYVLLDQTQERCAHDESCPGADCPLARWFARNPDTGKRAGGARRRSTKRR